MDYNNTFSLERAEQSAHERFKQWMTDAGWSTSYGRNPQDIFILLEEHGDDLSNDDLNDDN